MKTIKKIVILIIKCKKYYDNEYRRRKFCKLY